MLWYSCWDNEVESVIERAALRFYVILESGDGGACVPLL